VPNRHRRLQTRIIILITHNKTRPPDDGGSVLLRRTNIYTDAREIDKSRGHSSLHHPRHTRAYTARKRIIILLLLLLLLFYACLDYHLECFFNRTRFLFYFFPFCYFFISYARPARFGTSLGHHRYYLHIT